MLRSMLLIAAEDICQRHSSVMSEHYASKIAATYVVSSTAL
jgi:hypothetical protein